MSLKRSKKGFGDFVTQEQFLIVSRKTKTNIITAANTVNIIISQWEHELKTSRLLEARENKDKVVVDFSFASDWLRELREFAGPISELSYVKPKSTLNWKFLYVKTKVSVWTNTYWRPTLCKSLRLNKRQS